MFSWGMCIVLGVYVSLCVLLGDVPCPGCICECVCILLRAVCSPGCLCMHKECTHCMFMSVCSFSWRCVQRCVSVQGWLSEGIAPPFTLGQTSQFCMSCPLPRWARTTFSKPYLDKASKPSGHPRASRVMAVGFPWTDRCTAAPQSSRAPYQVRLSSLALWASVFPSAQRTGPGIGR